MGPKKGTAPKSHKLAKQFPQGTVLRDMLKKPWKLGQIIGQGGFGLIYLASANEDQTVTDKSAQYVIKIEPKSNGPMFCEMHFYIRGAKQENIKSFVSSKKLKYLSVPPFVATGDYTDNSQSYRFLVIPRFGRDLQNLLTRFGGTFPEHTVYGVGLRMIDALHYLHSSDYVHADIKASNIMLGHNSGKEIPNEVYLCDYGLAYRYRINGDLKPYSEDPKKAHDGTIEFTSRDAHKGVYPSRRGDLEILGYCMLQWLCGKLPWENKLTDPSYVAAQKFKYMSNVKLLIKDSLSGASQNASGTMLKFMESISKLDYQEEPQYAYLKSLLRTSLSNCDQKDEWKIDFSANQAEPKATKRKSRDAASPVVSSKQRRTSPQKKTTVTNGTHEASPDKIKSPASKRLPKKTSSPVKKAASVKRKSPSKPGASPTSPKSKPRQIPPPSKSSSKAKTSQKKSPTKKVSKSKLSPMTTSPSKSKSPTKTVPKSKLSPMTTSPSKSKSKMTVGSNNKRKSPRSKAKTFPMPPPSKR